MSKRAIYNHRTTPFLIKCSRAAMRMRTLTTSCDSPPAVQFLRVGGRCCEWGQSPDAPPVGLLSAAFSAQEVLRFGALPGLAGVLGSLRSRGRPPACGQCSSSLHPAPGRPLRAVGALQASLYERSGAQLLRRACAAPYGLPHSSPAICGTLPHSQHAGGESHEVVSVACTLAVVVRHSFR